MPDRPVDPERPRDANAFDRADGYAGQGYALDREQAEGARAADPAVVAGEDGLPPDNGRRASVDPATGEVHGGAVGAGGGQPGEDFSSDAATGDGYPLTGGEGSAKTPGDLGPKSDTASYL